MALRDCELISRFIYFMSLHSCLTLIYCPRTFHHVLAIHNHSALPESATLPFPIVAFCVSIDIPRILSCCRFKMNATDWEIDADDWVAFDWQNLLVCSGRPPTVETRDVYSRISHHWGQLHFCNSDDTRGLVVNMSHNYVLFYAVMFVLLAVHTALFLQKCPALSLLRT